MFNLITRANDTMPSQSKNLRGFTLIEIMIVVLIIGILLAIAVPNFINARESARKRSCTGNLRRIEWAKDAYLMQEKLPATTTPTPADLYGDGKFILSTPVCPGSGSYTIGDGFTSPTCDYLGGNAHLISGQ